MNVIRFIYRRLEILLILAVVFLVGQLLWPSVVHWWNLPRPGMVGLDQFKSNSMAKDFLIYLPAGYHSQTWPLVVFLHGSGERGHDANRLRGQGPLSQKIPAIIAVPQCLPSYSWEPNAVAGFVQYVASKYDVDRRQIYLIGYSMGGSGTWQVAAAHPELFAAIVPISGGGKPDAAKALAPIPVWAFHGAEDTVVPVEETQRVIEGIRDVGGNPRLTELRAQAHNICQVVCDRADFWDWLFQHRCAR